MDNSEEALEKSKRVVKQKVFEKKFSENFKTPNKFSLIQSVQSLIYLSVCLLIKTPDFTTNFGLLTWVLLPYFAHLSKLTVIGKVYFWIIKVFCMFVCSIVSLIVCSLVSLFVCLFVCLSTFQLIFTSWFDHWLFLNYNFVCLFVLL